MHARTAFFSLLSIAALASCKADKDLPKPTGLSGYWQLDKLECYCPPGTPSTPPNEAIEFDAAGNVRVYENGQLTQTGTYQLSQGTTDCAANAQLMTISFEPFTSHSPASYSIVNDQLVIDYGLCFDAPRKTYNFAPRRNGTGK